MFRWSVCIKLIIWHRIYCVKCLIWLEIGICAPGPNWYTLFLISITYNANVLIMDLHVVSLIVIEFLIFFTLRMWQHHNYIIIFIIYCIFCHLYFLYLMYFDLNIIEQHDSTHLFNNWKIQNSVMESYLIFVAAPAL